MKLLSTYISADKNRKSVMSIVDEQTYAVEYFHRDTLASYAYYDTAQQAEDAAEKYILETVEVK